MRQPVLSSNQSSVLALNSVADKLYPLVTVPGCTASRTARNDHFLAADLHGQFLQRLGRRPGGHPPVQVIRAIVAGAPDLPPRLLVLDGTVQVGAYRRKRLPLGIVSRSEEDTSELQ